MRIEMSSRVVSSEVRLIVVDQRNPPLSHKLLAVTGAADQILFERTAEMTGPLRLYLGNSSAVAPGYDDDRTLPSAPQPGQHAGSVRRRYPPANPSNQQAKLFSRFEC